MQFSSLDAIVRNTLLQRGYPIHYYLDFLVYSAQILRELTFDDLMIVNTKLIPVDEFNNFQIPNDYQDYVTVGAQIGQYIYPLVETDEISQLDSYDENFNQVLHGGNTPPALTTPEENNVYYGLFPFASWYTVHWNNYGENIGRYFGNRGPYPDTFVVKKAKNKIQINQNITLDNAYLVYISNGYNYDAATTVDQYAIQTIQAYSIWQHKENNRNYSIGERQLAKDEYISQRKILRARKSNLTPERLKRIIQQTTFASPK